MGTESYSEEMEFTLAKKAKDCLGTLLTTTCTAILRTLKKMLIELRNQLHRETSDATGKWKEDRKIPKSGSI